MSCNCVSVGASSHQQTCTCLPTEPADNYCICAWSDLKPLGQQQRPCQAANHDSNIVNEPSLLHLESAVYWPQNHHGHSCFRRKLKSFFYFHQYTLVHSNTVLGHRSFVGGNIRLCITILYCIVHMHQSFKLSDASKFHFE